MAAPAIPPIRLGLTGTGLAVEKRHRPASRGPADRLVPSEGRSTGTPWRQRPQYRGTMDAPSDLALDLVFTGGAVGDHTASYPEIPVPPEANDMRLYGTEGVLVLAGSESERRVTRSSSDATTHTTVFRGIDNGYRAELVDFADAVRFGMRPVGRTRGSTGLFDGLPRQRISSSASFAA